MQVYVPTLPGAFRHVSISWHHNVCMYVFMYTYRHCRNFSGIFPSAVITMYVCMSVYVYVCIHVYVPTLPKWFWHFSISCRHNVCMYVCICVCMYSGIRTDTAENFQAFFHQLSSQCRGDLQTRHYWPFHPCMYVCVYLCMS